MNNLNKSWRKFKNEELLNNNKNKFVDFFPPNKLIFLDEWKSVFLVFFNENKLYNLDDWEKQLEKGEIRDQTSNYTQHTLQN